MKNLLLIAAICASALSFAQGPHAKISVAQAKKAATAKYHGTVVGKVELENEDGKWQYAVNVRSGKTLREVMVDSHTGKIASVEVTSEKEERAEAKAEKSKAAKKSARKSKHS